MPTTIRQVATAAGVSIATASRALNGSDAVVAATRDRVLEVASALHYTPSRLGRSLATGSTGNIGVVLPDMTNPFYTSFLAELEATLGASDRGVLIGDSHERVELERSLIVRMTGQVDALILASSRLPDRVLVETAERLPVVLANRMLEPRTRFPEQLSQIALDVQPGFVAAAQHLHEIGHTGLLYIDGPVRSWSGRQKRAALEQACAERGMTFAALSTDTPDFAGGRHAVEAARLTGTTAIVAFNDQLALGALSALRDAGYRVPDDVSVIGCDDSLPDGLAWPALTTVDSSARTLGALTAEAINRPIAHHTASVPSRLIIRDSTSAPPAHSSTPTPAERRMP